MTALGVRRPLVMTREDYRLARLDDLARVPVSSITEEELLTGYRFSVPRTTLEHVCACGGLVRSVDIRAAIVAAVEAHNGSSQHLRWREAR